MSPSHNTTMAGKRKLSQTATIRRARGSLRGKMGNKPFAERMTEWKREEMQLEERKMRRLK